MITEKVRIDKWLWAARFYKTRSLASAAVRGGHVHVNGKRIKPARNLLAGEKLEIKRGEVEFEIFVVSLSSRRGPAAQAQLLYEETAQSLKKREKEREERKLFKGPVAVPSRRPDKRERRKIRKFQRNE